MGILSRIFFVIGVAKEVIGEHLVAVDPSVGSVVVAGVMIVVLGPSGLVASGAVGVLTRR